jgi:glucan phosphoethanolaminetransferase (alkaline phosphatase superfamily)
MALKLFRTTGYSTLLMPGEARLATHPGRVVLGASLWLALACNVGLWRLLSGSGEPRTAAAFIAIIGGGSALLLSLLCWRRTFKPAVTFVLAISALVACGIWSQQLPVEQLWHPSRSLLPAWASFMRWQVPALVLVLAVLPSVWLWNHPLRRLAGPEQLRANFLAAVAGLVVLVAGLALL